MLMTRPNLKGRSFSRKDFTQEELLYFLDLAKRIKREKKMVSRIII